LNFFTGSLAGYFAAYTLSWRRFVGPGYTNAFYTPATPGTYFNPDEEVDLFLQKMGRETTTKTK
jgi:hypothetical protein